MKLMTNKDMLLITQKIAMTRDLGVHGNLFGGNMLSWIDEAAGLMATKICRTTNMVTVKMEEVNFKRPVKMGFSISIYGKVVKMGTSSITLYMEARKHNVYSGEETLVTSTKIVFVRIDEVGDPIPITEEIRKNYLHLNE
jgi:acyl-CoA thioesterase YciA